jgi:hypothetical protein
MWTLFFKLTDAGKFEWWMKATPLPVFAMPRWGQSRRFESGNCRRERLVATDFEAQKSTQQTKLLSVSEINTS